MQLKTSLDWPMIETKLRKDLARINYNPDLRNMLKNIETMVTELSKEEVVARQTKRTHTTEKQAEKINKAVIHLEKLILIAQIMD